MLPRGMEKAMGGGGGLVAKRGWGALGRPSQKAAGRLCCSQPSHAHHGGDMAGSGAWPRLLPCWCHP